MLIVQFLMNLSGLLAAFILLSLFLFFFSPPSLINLVFPLSSIRSLTPWYFSLCYSLTPTMIPFSFPGFYSYAKIWTPIDDLERGASNEIGNFWFLGLSCLTYDLFQFQHLTTKVMTYFPSQMNSICTTYTIYHRVYAPYCQSKSIRWPGFLLPVFGCWPLTLWMLWIRTCDM